MRHRLLFASLVVLVFAVLGDAHAFVPPVASIAQSVAADNASDRCADGPLQGLPTLFNSTGLGTTPAKVTLPTGSTDPANGVCLRVRIFNPSSTATISWKPVVTGATAPTSGNMTADYASTGATPIPPGGSSTVSLQLGRDLYVVASGASTSVNVTSYLIQ